MFKKHKFLKKKERIYYENKNFVQKDSSYERKRKSSYYEFLKRRSLKRISYKKIFFKAGNW